MPEVACQTPPYFGVPRSETFLGKIERILEVRHPGVDLYKYMEMVPIEPEELTARGIPIPPPEPSPLKEGSIKSCICGHEIKAHRYVADLGAKEAVMVGVCCVAAFGRAATRECEVCKDPFKMARSKDKQSLMCLNCIKAIKAMKECWWCGADKFKGRTHCEECVEEGQTIYL